MKKFSLFLTLIAFLLFFFSCEKPSLPEDPGTEPDIPEEPSRSQTILIYMMGNNGLENFMDNNLGQILSVTAEKPDSTRIAIFYDRGNYTKLTEAYISEDGRVKQRLIEEYNPSATSSVDPGFMKEVFAKVKEELPSETFGLILSSHGGGWVPSSLFDYYLQHATPSATGISPSFFGQDDDDCMEIPDLAEVLQGFNFEYIIFDACFMSSIEALYDLRNTARSIVASSAEILGTGFPYKQVMPVLFKNNRNLKGVCEEYMNVYKENSGTISLIDCSGLNQLAESVKAIMAEIEQGPCDASAIQGYDGFTSHLYFDFAQYIRQVCNNEKLLTDFEHALSEAIRFTDHSARFYTSYGDRYYDLPESCGLTCHVEQAGYKNTHDAYLKTSWAKIIGAE